MQIRAFTVPVSDSGDMQEDLNRFLRGKRILEVCQHFVADGPNRQWCFLVKYLESDAKPASGAAGRPIRTDYKDLLDPVSFARFARLRAIRKKLSEEDGIPAFAVFTDEQMAELAKQELFSPESMKQVRGIGEGKTERYAARIQKLLEARGDETNGTSD